MLFAIGFFNSRVTYRYSSASIQKRLVVITTVLLSGHAKTCISKFKIDEKLIQIQVYGNGYVDSGVYVVKLEVPPHSLTAYLWDLSSRSTCQEHPKT